MRDVMMLRGAEPRKILETVVSEQIPAIMSYMSRGRWHVAKILLTELGAGRLSVEVSPRKKPQPLNIRPEQDVGVSIKYGYGKFIFETTVMGLEPSTEPEGRGRITLAVPKRIEMVQRRSYFRVQVPEGLKVNVVMWHSGFNRDVRRGPGNYWKGRLIDISAGGLQIALNSAFSTDFKEGQTLGIRFTPEPYVEPLMFNAQIRSVLPTVGGDRVCLGLQIIGLEASAEGRTMLSRLVGVVEHYHQVNQRGVKQRDFQATSV